MEFEGYNEKFGKIKQLTQKGKLYPVYEPKKLPIGIDYIVKLRNNQYTPEIPTRV